MENKNLEKLLKELRGKFNLNKKYLSMGFKKDGRLVVNIDLKQGFYGYESFRCEELEERNAYSFNLTYLGLLPAAERTFLRANYKGEINSSKILREFYCEVQRRKKEDPQSKDYIDFLMLRNFSENYNEVKDCFSFFIKEFNKKSRTFESLF